MYERTYGYLYDRDRSVKDDAALIRATIKTMSSAGVLPADWKYSVRFHRASMCQEINITALSPRPIRLMNPGTVSAAPDRRRCVRVPHRSNDGTLTWLSLWLQPGERYEIRWMDAQTDEARAVAQALQELLNACNHDGSDSQSDHFDVKFYGHPVLDTMDGVPREERERPSYWPARLARR